MKNLGRIIALAISGKINPEKFDSGYKFLKTNFESVEFSNQIYHQFRNMAGTDKARLKSLIDGVQSNSADVLWAIRGGFGAIRILDIIPKNLTIQNKILIGYSDITAYQWFFYKNYQMKSIAGPMIQVDLSKSYDFKNFEILLSLIQKKNTLIKLNHSVLTHAYKNIEAPIIGGCLSIICSLFGTDFMPDLRNHILFLEDVNEDIYRLDTMFAQLKLNGVLNIISGLILGQFTSENQSVERNEELYELYKEYFWDLDIPIIYNFPHGHIENLTPLPIGYIARFRKNEIEFSYG